MPPCSQIFPTFRKPIHGESLMLKPTTKEAPRQYQSLTLPTELQGMCRNAKRCRSWDVILGNGLCVTCWDMQPSNALVEGNHAD